MTKQYLGQHRCAVCAKLVRVYNWLPTTVLCAKHKRYVDGPGEAPVRKAAKVRRHKFKAEPVGLADPAPSPSKRFEQTDEERMFARAHLRTQKALLGEIGPRSAYACVFGAALLCVEAGVEAAKAYDAFQAEYERVSKEWDKWKLGEHERLKAEVGLVKAKGKSEGA